MFSADLSWNDGSVEKVGQRRQRRANKRENSIRSSTSDSKSEAKYAPSFSHANKPSLGSITKSISFSSVKGSLRRPPTAASVHQTKAPPVTVIDASVPYRDYKDPVQQPDYVYSAKLGPRLPSGAPIESPRLHESASNYSLPVLSERPRHAPIWEEDQPSYRATSPRPTGPHKAWSFRDRSEAEGICQSYEQMKDEILALQKPDVIVPKTETIVVGGPAALRSMSDLPEYDESSVSEPAELADNFAGRPRSVASHHLLLNEETSRTKYVLPPSGFEPNLDLHSLFRSNQAKIEKDDRPIAHPTAQGAIGRTPTVKVSQWNPPDNWDIVKSQVEIRKIMDSDSSNEDVLDDRRQSMFVGSHFQRFVRRMESAGPRIILERLKEEWDLPGDRTMSDELQLEKHLWALTALQLQSMDRFARQNCSFTPIHPLPPTTPKRRRKILELDGSIGEIYQLSAIYPNSRIYHLTKTPQGSSIPLPGQAVQHEINMGSPNDNLGNVPMSAAGVLPLPYANSSMHHIRSTRLPTLLPASQLPALLSECHRVLKPGGLLELRLMDATPDRRSMGPLLANWLEERLLLGLEADFRCQRPIMLIPRWAREAGFVPLRVKDQPNADDATVQSLKANQGLARCLRLPAVASNPHAHERDIVAQVGVLVSRSLWKDCWGSYIHDDYEEHWWWENAEIIDECREWNTTWDVGTMYVMKDLSSA